MENTNAVTPETHATRLLSTVGSVKASGSPEKAVQLLKEYDSRIDHIDADGGGYDEAGVLNDIIWSEIESATRSVAEEHPNEFLDELRKQYDTDTEVIPTTVFGVMAIATISGYALQKTNRSFPTVLEPYRDASFTPRTNLLTA